MYIYKIQLLYIFSHQNFLIFIIYKNNTYFCGGFGGAFLYVFVKDLYADKKIHLLQLTHKRGVLFFA